LRSGCWPDRGCGFHAAKLNRGIRPAIAAIKLLFGEIEDCLLFLKLPKHAADEMGEGKGVKLGHGYIPLLLFRYG
jgi:hypothetical protein